MAGTLSLSHMEAVPTAPSRLKAWFVSLGALPLAVASFLWFLYIPGLHTAFTEAHPEVMALFALRRVDIYFPLIFAMLGLAGVVPFVLGVCSLIRRPLFLQMLRGSFWTVYLFGTVALCLIHSILMRIPPAEIPFEGMEAQDAAIMLKVWFRYALPVGLCMAWTGWLHVLSHTRSVVAVFEGKSRKTCQASKASQASQASRTSRRQLDDPSDADRRLDADPATNPDAPLPGDYVLENLRTHGRDPRLRKGSYASLFLHGFVLIGIPLLARIGGCIEPYRVPFGSGDPVVAFVQVVQPKPKVEQRLALNPDSAIYYHVPDLDESDIQQQVEQETQLTYEAHAEAQAGAIGKGGGDQGGWPEGMRDGEIRFIRLRHNGRGWDDGMGRHAADRNFLAEVRRVTGLPTRRDGEHIDVTDLNRYRPDEFPPFVFFTGTARFSLRPNEQQALRNYLLQGGMLFATGGSRDFDRSFRSLMQTLFPGNPMVDIPDDDILFQQPFRFPHGPPSVEAHAGRHSFGVRHEGRWIVYYHPGDLNDPWKSSQFQEYRPEVQRAAMQLGINIVYYSFNQWDAIVGRRRR